MNFTYMIILLLALLFYISLKIGFNRYLSIILVVILLVLYEIYNYQEFNLDKFNTSQSEYDRKYKFNKHIKPYDIARKEFKQFDIPYQDNEQLKHGLPCEVQKEVYKYMLKSGKLADQKNMVNLLYSHKPFNEPSLNEDNLDLTVFDPLEIQEIEDVECPTVCHLEDNETKCKEKKFIPVMNSVSDYQDSLERDIRACKNKTNAGDDAKDICEKDKKCAWDPDYNKCYYDKRGCLWRSHSLNEDDTEKKNIYAPPQCYKRCEYMDIPGEQNKSKYNCETAVYYDGKADNKNKITRYCEWIETRDSKPGKCVTHLCSIYGNRRECMSDSSCEWGGKEGCIKNARS